MYKAEEMKIMILNKFSNHAEFLITIQPEKIKPPPTQTINNGKQKSPKKKSEDLILEEGLGNKNLKSWFNSKI